MDSDDWWEKDKLQIQIKVINKSAATLCYGNYSFTSLTENGLKIILKRVVVPITTTYRQLLKRSRIWTGTVLIDTKKIDRNQIRMPDIKIGEDLILWLSILKAGHKVIGVQKNLAFYWRTNKDKTLSSNKKEAALARWSIYYEFEKLGFFRSLYHMYFYVFDAIMRRF
ncbi:MAG: hypothetical protein Q3996_00295 [Candidatus Saccharibacteria bacterium]|nr:hypothetical protein [Candidatus Saccharibacteria bacterium]